MGHLPPLGAPCSGVSPPYLQKEKKFPSILSECTFFSLKQLPMKWPNKSEGIFIYYHEKMKSVFHLPYKTNF